MQTRIVVDGSGSHTRETNSVVQRKRCVWGLPVGLACESECNACVIGCVLPPLCNSWMIMIVKFYIALNITPSVDCYRVGAVPT